jgi:DNA-binding MarR family transcriptional regulator
VEALAAGEKVLERRAQVLDDVAVVIDQGRFLTNTTREPPAVTAEGIVGGVFAVLHTRLLEEGDEPLTDLLGPLMSMIVLPYLGARAASRELGRPALEVAKQRAPRGQSRSRDPLEGLNMRLTYRTVRVLMVIAEHPGASNREIAEGSGIVDQGQISKLLNRLARLKLVENRGEGQEKGAANAWHLTPRGAQVERATRPR